MHRVRLLSLLLVACVASLPQLATRRTHGRSMTITTNGIVATSQTLASQAGIDILYKGGSAVDAAIAANAVLSVVEPMMDGIGGDLFALIWTANDGKLQGLNASGWAPKDLTIDFLRAQKHKVMPRTGIHSVTVPGAVAGWAAMHQRYGKLPWKHLFQAAIYYAEHGFPVTERIAAFWSSEQGTKRLAKAEAGPDIFLPGGKPPAVGQIFRNPELAHAFRLIAERGPDTVYRGEIAQAILATSRKLGGRMQASDLAEWAPEWVDPISTTYRGWTVYELPPNGSGIGALEMLNLMENKDVSSWPAGSADALHWRIETMRLAYADLWHHVSDPRFINVPIKGMLSKDFARRRTSAIDMAKASCKTLPAGELSTDGNTTYLTVVDRDGNIASWIQSVAGGWGSFVNVEGMGFHLQNRGSYFRLEKEHANALAPRKRPFHTIIPAFMQKGDLRVGFGIMGGPGQPYSHAQFISNIADYGMNIQAAMDAPRFRGTAANNCELSLEAGRIAAEAVKALAVRGHKINNVGPYDMSSVGVGQVVMRDVSTGVNYGASDARGDGAAIPENPAIKQ